MREITKELDVEIVKGHLSPDHVQMLVSIPPHLSISKFVQRIKGKTSRKLQMEHKELQQRYWDKHIWARGYFCASAGIVTDEQIKDYIEHHNEVEDENFTIEKT